MKMSAQELETWQGIAKAMRECAEMENHYFTDEQIAFVDEFVAKAEVRKRVDRKRQG